MCQFYRCLYIKGNNLFLIDISQNKKYYLTKNDDCSVQPDFQ